MEIMLADGIRIDKELCNTVLGHAKAKGNQFVKNLTTGKTYSLHPFNLKILGKMICYDECLGYRQIRRRIPYRIFHRNFRRILYWISRRILRGILKPDQAMAVFKTIDIFCRKNRWGAYSPKDPENPYF